MALPWCGELLQKFVCLPFVHICPIKIFVCTSFERKLRPAENFKNYTSTAHGLYHPFLSETRLFTSCPRSSTLQKKKVMIKRKFENMLHKLRMNFFIVST